MLRSFGAAQLDSLLGAGGVAAAILKTVDTADPSLLLALGRSAENESESESENV